MASIQYIMDSGMVVLMGPLEGYCVMLKYGLGNRSCALFTVMMRLLLLMVRRFIGIPRILEAKTYIIN